MTELPEEVAHDPEREFWSFSVELTSDEHERCMTWATPDIQTVVW